MASLQLEDYEGMGVWHAAAVMWIHGGDSIEAGGERAHF